MYANGKSSLSYLITSTEACTFSVCVNLGFHVLLILLGCPLTCSLNVPWLWINVVHLVLSLNSFPWKVL